MDVKWNSEEAPEILNTKKLRKYEEEWSSFKSFVAFCRMIYIIFSRQQAGDSERAKKLSEREPERERESARETLKIKYDLNWKP